jgi:hypothetical protein
VEPLRSNPKNDRAKRECVISESKSFSSDRRDPPRRAPSAQSERPAECD